MNEAGENLADTAVGVFISYAHEDIDKASRLYEDLKDAGLNPWLDTESLLAGQNWEIAIRKAIKNNKYFIPLFSSTSVQKRGFIQKEFKFALDVLEEIPESDIFVIPIRLDDCDIPYEKLTKYHYVDLFPNWKEGIKKILKAMGTVDSSAPAVSTEPLSTTNNVRNISSDERYYHVRIYVYGRGSYYETDLTKDGLLRAIVNPYGKGQSFYFSNASTIDSMKDIRNIEIRYTKEDSSTVMNTLMKEPTKRFRRFFMFQSKSKLIFEAGLNVTREFIYFSPGTMGETK